MASSKKLRPCLNLLIQIRYNICTKQKNYFKRFQKSKPSMYGHSYSRIKPSKSDSSKKILGNCFNRVNSLFPVCVNLLKKKITAPPTLFRQLNEHYIFLFIVHLKAQNICKRCDLLMLVWSLQFPLSTSIQPHYWNQQTVAFACHIFIIT